MTQWFPIAGSIIVTLIFIFIGIYAFRQRRGSGYHSGGFVSDYRPDEIAVAIRDQYRRSPRYRSISERMRTILLRESYSPDTRAVLEVLDLMQRPAVREAVMPEISRRYGYSPDSGSFDEPYVAPSLEETFGPCPSADSVWASPEVTSEQPSSYRLFYSDYDGPLEDGEEPPEDSWHEIMPDTEKHFSRFWRVKTDKGLTADHILPTPAWFHSANGPYIKYDFETPFDVAVIPLGDVTDADQAERFFDSDGEPMATPPPPNIGGEDHPPYAGPNYVERQDIADEMKGIRHYGTEGADDD